MAWEVQSGLAMMPEERPRERLHCVGADALAAEELVALVLGTGRRGACATQCARELLAAAGGLAALSRLRPTELLRLPGLGPARASRLAAAFALGRRALRASSLHRPTVNGPQEVVSLMAPQLVGLAHESFWVLALSVKNEVIDRREIGRGSLTSVEVHPREIFRFLIRVGASAAIAVHNHPSGDETPSEEDVELTDRLVLSGQLMGIPLVDHIVVGAGRFCSILAHAGDVLGTSGT